MPLENNMLAISVREECSGKIGINFRTTTTAMMTITTIASTTST